MSAMWLGWLTSHNARANQRLRDGDTARDARQWDAAAQHYNAYLDLKPKDWGIRVQLGHAMKEAGRLLEAEGAYRAAAEAAPEDADVLIHLGHLLKTLGRPSDADAVFRRCAEVLELQPENPRANEMRRAVSEATRPSFRALGDQARDAREWLEAARQYRAHLELEPTDFAIWIQLGNVSKEAQQFGSAEAAYRRAMDIDPSQPEAALQLGHLLKLLDRRDEAREAYRRATELGGGAEPLREFSALAHWGARGGDERSATERSFFEAARPFSSDIATSDAGGTVKKPEILTEATLRLFLNAQAARDQRSWDLACALYGSYVLKSPSDTRAWHEYAAVLRESGRYELAYDAALHARAEGAEPFDLKRERVELLRHLGRHSQAEALLRELVLQNGPAAGDLEIIR